MMLLALNTSIILGLFRFLFKSLFNFDWYGQSLLNADHYLNIIEGNNNSVLNSVIPLKN